MDDSNEYKDAINSGAVRLCSCGTPDDCKAYPTPNDTPGCRLARWDACRRDRGRPSDVIGRMGHSENLCTKVMHREYDMKWICTLPKGHSGPHNSAGTR